MILLYYISLRVELSTIQNFYLQILSDDVITDILMFSDLFLLCQNCHIYQEIISHELQHVLKCPFVTV